MKRRWWNDSMTLLVIRDAEKAVRQVNVPKLLIVSVPIAALMSLSGLVLSMHLKSAQQIQELEGRLSSQTFALDIMVKDKDEAIRLLQTEIVRLSAEANSVKTKVSEMSNLESQLEQFVGSYLDGDVKDESQRVTSMSDHTWNNSTQVGGEEISVSNDDLLQLAQVSRNELQEVNNLLRSMQESMPVTLQRAIDKQATLEGTPSIWPTKSQVITSSFGYRSDPLTGNISFHSGIDIGASTGDPVYAAANGTVIAAEYSPSRGNYIVIRHMNGLETWYMHLSKIEVRVNQKVTKSKRIGKVGSTGRSTGSHLHFEVVKNGDVINPLPYMSAGKNSAIQKIGS